MDVSMTDAAPTTGEFPYCGDACMLCKAADEAVNMFITSNENSEVDDVEKFIDEIFSQEVEMPLFSGVTQCVPMLSDYKEPFVCSSCGGTEEHIVPMLRYFSEACHSHNAFNHKTISSFMDGYGDVVYGCVYDLCQACCVQLMPASIFILNDGFANLNVYERCVICDETMHYCHDCRARDDFWTKGDMMAACHKDADGTVLCEMCGVTRFSLLDVEAPDPKAVELIMLSGGAN
jgi:hypothetical protein